MSFLELYRKYSFAEIAFRISGEEAYRYGISSPPESGGHSDRFTEGDVRRALDRFESGLNERDLMALLSPASRPFLEEMAQKARYVTRKRFGNVMLLYAPLYLSNECRSSCTYCGFSYENKIPRVTLSIEDVERDADVLYERGIRHILLLTGEDYKKTPVSYLEEVAEKIRHRFPSIGIEVYPLKEEEYVRLRDAGVDALTIYQETYDEEVYRSVHLRGMKQNFEYRMDTPDRAGNAGFRRIAIGALLGLSDPAAEVFFTALHARYLMKKYWKSQVLIGLPRLRPAHGIQNVPVLPDSEYVRYLIALRLYLPDGGLVLSTRESPRLRDHMSDICITQMSAASRTDPGGYFHESHEDNNHELEQFHVEDDRSVEEIVQMLDDHGKEAVFVDWSYEMK